MLVCVLWRWKRPAPHRPNRPGSYQRDTGCVTYRYGDERLPLLVLLGIGHLVFLAAVQTSRDR